MNESAVFPRCVGPLTVDPVARKLVGPAGEVTVEPLVMRLFNLLLDDAGEVVPRRDIFASLWGNGQVGDDSLNRLVVRLRQALRQCAGGGLTIETVPRAGYRLLVWDDDDCSPDLARRYLIGGGLAAAVAGAGLWRYTHDRKALARRWIDEGDVRLRDAAPVEAGLALAPLRKAIELEPGNSRALGLLALAEETQANNGGSPDAGASLRSAEQAAQEALRHDPQEPHARLALLDMSGASLDWSAWDSQLRQLHAGSPGNLHVLGSLSSFFQAAGQTAQAWSLNEQVCAAAPSSPTPQWRRVLRLWTGGHEEAALQLSERAVQIWPHHPLVWNARFMMLAFTGRIAAASAMVNQTNPVLNSHPLRSEQWAPTFAAFAEPTAAHVAKARNANLAAAQQSPGQAAYAAMALSHLGELNAAFAVIDAVLLARGPLVTARARAPGSFVANSPSWCRTQWLFMPPLAAVRDDPRFGRICDDIGLSRYWRTHGGGPNMALPVGALG